MRSQLVRPFLARVRAAGGDAPALLARLGLPADALDAAEVVLPLGAMVAFGDAAAVAAGDPFLGVHVAETLDRGTYGVVEFACRSAPTTREALRRIARYMALLNEIVFVTFDEASGVVEQKVPGWPLCVGRQANEFFVAMLLHQARQLSGRPCIPEQVWLAHPLPADTAELRRAYGTARLEGGAGRNALALSAEELDAPLRSSDPQLLSILDKHAAGELASRGGPNRFLGQVRQLVQEALVAFGAPALADTAGALRMSPRTFQRRLADEGTSWQALVDSVREATARSRVLDRSVPLGEIAYQCGYAELSAFLRAFKRWTGTSPTEMRASRLTG